MTKQELTRRLNKLQDNLEKTQIKALRYYQSYNILKKYWDSSVDSDSINSDKKIYDIKKKLKNLIL